MKKSVFIKRVISCAAAAALAVTVLAGCENGKETSDVTSISFWSGDGHLKEAYEKLIDEFNSGVGKENGVKIDFTFVAGDSYVKNLDLALQNGNGPDIMTSRTNLSAFKQYVELGYLAPLEVLPHSGELLEQYESMLGINNIFNGKAYSFPICSTVQGLIYNTKMFKDAGLVDENGNPTPPKTFAQLEEYAEKLTDESKNRYGIIFPRKWTGWANSDVRNVVFESTGNMGFDYVAGKWDFTKQAEVLKYYINIENDRNCFPGDSAIDNDAARAYFAEGNIGMKIAYSFDVGVLQDQFPAKIDWEVAPLPVLDENAAAYKPFLSVDHSPWINAKAVESKGADKLEIVYNFLSSDEVAKHMYQNGLRLPVKPEIINSVELDSSMKQWKGFADIAANGVVSPGTPSFDAASIPTLQDVVISIMAGDATPQDGLTKLAGQMQEATEKYYSNGNESEYKSFLIPDWNSVSVRAAK